MRITVKLFATLRKGRFEIEDREFSERASVGSVMRALKIPRPQAAIVFVNGIHADFGRRLADGDILAIFPPSGGG